MKKMNLQSIPRMSKNTGIQAEYALTYTLTGTYGEHDRVRFDMGSDIPAYDMSVKSTAFSLADARAINGETLEEKIEDYRERVASTSFAYVTKDLTNAYIMNLDEFCAFMMRWCYLCKESAKNSGLMKVRCLKESKRMLDWLEVRA